MTTHTIACSRARFDRLTCSVEIVFGQFVSVLRDCTFTRKTTTTRSRTTSRTTKIRRNTIGATTDAIAAIPPRSFARTSFAARNRDRGYRVTTPTRGKFPRFFSETDSITENVWFRNRAIETEMKISFFVVYFLAKTAPFPDVFRVQPSSRTTAYEPVVVHLSRWKIGRRSSHFLGFGFRLERP